MPALEAPGAGALRCDEPLLIVVFLRLFVVFRDFVVYLNDKTKGGQCQQELGRTEEVLRSESCDC